MGSAARRKSRPIHEKESVKWLEGLAHLSALKLRCAHTQLIGIGDRESDVYELFAAQRPEDGTGWCVRPGTAAHIVPRAISGRPCSIPLQPLKARASQLPGLDVFAIHAIEGEPPPGIEPIEWVLLGSVPTLPRTSP
ncbi:hypothetical protein [Burkholderia cenocepacia]|uniref:hypothetical protein n=1 Tax=Burkholderia cenocepacia TaxID=95486 RepID=UPI001F49C56D|nr:hypothetical protein [Burkholderia cenocepacia]